MRAPTDQHTLTGSRLRRSLALMGRGMRAEPRIYVLAVASSAVFGAATVAVSLAVGWATDDVVVPALQGDGAARGRLAFAVGILVLVAAVLAVGVAGRRVFAGWGYVNLQARHRRNVTRKYLRLPLSWHRSHPAGQLLANASSDVDAATGVFNPLPFALGVVVMIAVAAVMLVRIDVWLACAALSVLPLAVAANLVYQRRMDPAATRAQQLRAEVAAAAHESFEAALLVKALGTADREEERFAARAAELRDANVRVGTVRAFFDPVIELLPSVGTLLVLGIGAGRVAAGAVETGDIVTAAFLLTLMAVPVRAFGWVLGELPRGLVGHDRISRVIDAGGELADGTTALGVGRGGAGPGGGPAVGPAEGMAVRLEGVGLDVPLGPDLVTLLDDVRLDLAPGTTVAVVGPTGAGKTTLVSLLSRLSDPTRGRVLLDGADLRTIRSADLAAQVALVAQQTFVFEDTVRANVTLTDAAEPGTPTDDDVWRALHRARVDDVVADLPGGLDARLGERGANLSGGQRQRLAIARALVRRPRLLVLDDATSAVDPRIERSILAGLRREAGTTGDGQRASELSPDESRPAELSPTVVMVAYRMSSVALADVVVHLAGGRVVDVGSHAELLARDPGYAELATAYARETERRERRLADLVERPPAPAAPGGDEGDAS